MDNESRNTSAGIRADQAQPGAPTHGVGGRLHAPCPPPQGGGYSPSCDAPEVPLLAGGAAGAAPGRDPRIEELRRMGMRPIWIKVADAIGFDAFVDMWRTMSENEDLLDERNRVTIASFATYLRFQRNQLIRSLAAEHSGALSICEDLRQNHRIDLSVSAVKRVLSKMRA